MFKVAYSKYKNVTPLLIKKEVFKNFNCKNLILFEILKSKIYPAYPPTDCQTPSEA